MQTQPIHVTNGRRHVLDVRRALFGFSEVLEVFATSGRDVLIVVCSGRPHVGAWQRALREAGFEILTAAHLAPVT